MFHHGNKNKNKKGKKKEKTLSLDSDENASMSLFAAHSVNKVYKQQAPQAPSK